MNLYCKARVRVCTPIEKSWMMLWVSAIFLEIQNLNSVGSGTLRWDWSKTWLIWWNSNFSHPNIAWRYELQIILFSLSPSYNLFSLIYSHNALIIFRKGAFYMCKIVAKGSLKKYSKGDSCTFIQIVTLMESHSPTHYRLTYMQSKSDLLLI